MYRVPDNNPSGPFMEFLQYLYISLLCSLTVLFLSHCYCNLRRCNVKLSWQFKVHMFCWVFSSSVTFFYYAPLVYYVVFPGKLSTLFNTSSISAAEYNLFCLSFRGSANLAVIFTMPLSMTLLAIERIVSLKYPTFLQSRYRVYAQIAGASILLINFSTLFHVIFWRSYTEGKETTTCLALACLILNKINDLVVYKMAVGAFNICIGVYFVWIFCNFRKTLANQREKRVGLC